MENLDFGRKSFVRVKGVKERIQEAEALEKNLIETIRAMTTAQQKKLLVYIEQMKAEGECFDWPFNDLRPLLGIKKKSMNG